MLAALIATRQAPAPRIVFYGNQLVASTTTFSCLTIIRRAAFITTSLPVRTQLSLSLPGSEALLDQLNRMYFRLISPTAGNDPIFLSATIQQVIVIVTRLISILSTLPVSTNNTLFLVRLQSQAALSLRILNSLAIPPGVLIFT